MNTAFRLVFALFALLSVLDLMRMGHRSVSSSEPAASSDEFEEFGKPEEEAVDPSLKYSQQANEREQGEEQLGGDDGLEIRPPTSYHHPSSAGSFQVHMNMPSIKFHFCVSCGYKQAYEQFSQVLHDKYPGVQIEGANYPPSSVKAVLSQVIGISKIALIVMIVMGRDPFQSLGMATPGVFSWMLNNKLSSCLMLFMLSNSVEGMLMSTGAFEIYFGEERIWSKLESGRVPSPAELITAIDSQLAIRGGGGASGGGAGVFGFDQQ